MLDQGKGTNVNGRVFLEALLDFLQSTDDANKLCLRMDSVFYSNFLFPAQDSVFYSNFAASVKQLIRRGSHRLGVWMPTRFCLQTRNSCGGVGTGNRCRRTPPQGRPHRWPAGRRWRARFLWSKEEETWKDSWRRRY